MAQQNHYPLIFTDLDGTLLDHHSYSASPADGLIAQLKARNIGQVIPVTSKTRSELAVLRETIPLHYSIGVTENGSVIDDRAGLLGGAKGDARTHILGMEYQQILAAIAALPQHLAGHISGFANMSPKQIAAATGLDLADAERAGQREATEPFLWSGNDDELAEVQALLAQSGIELQRGGRFYHLTGKATKKMAIAQIASAMRVVRGDAHIVCIALGDGPNDLGMIEAADYGVIMPNPDGVTILSEQKNVRTAPYAGPKGWIAAVQNILSELGFNLRQS
jgi:mannosyl-3-phosphoglycerate phosphatase family protein